MKHILNKNISHDGVYMEKGEVCPEKFVAVMKSMGHVDEVKPAEVSAPAPAQEEKPKKKKGKW